MDIIEIISWLILLYALFYSISKIFFAVISVYQIRRYTNKYPHVATQEDLNKHAERNEHDIPLITIINPAFNEGTTIVASVKSFIRQSYPKVEIIVVNDGSKDDTLERLKAEFKLYKTERDIKIDLETERVLDYYKSDYSDRLIVVDKENGGKSDALNAAIAVAEGDIIVPVDADSILETNALIHIADIFEQDPTVIGIGTPIGVVNDGNVGPDGVEDASFPKNFLARNQVMEYLRNFLLGRMALQKFRGLVLISGAFGVYQKWILEAIGGFHKNSLSEDMDIVCKIWQFLDHNKLNFTLKYIPEVFCWTQVPERVRDLRTQRDRWARGMTQTIWNHRKLIFNPRYKMLGLFSYPYYILFEWLTPFIEIGSLISMIPLIYFGIFNIAFLSKVFLAYYFLASGINVATVIVEASTGGHYKGRGVLLKLLVVAFTEPLFFHWLNSAFYVYGNIRLFSRENRSWGKIQRKKIKLIPVATNQVTPEEQTTKNLTH